MMVADLRLPVPEDDLGEDEAACFIDLVVQLDQIAALTSFTATDVSKDEKQD